MPRLEALRQEFRSRGLEIVGLTTTPVSHNAEEYLRKSKFTFEAGRISRAFFKKYRFSLDHKPITAMTTFLIDRTGKIVFRDYDTDYDDLRKELTKLVR